MKNKKKTLKIILILIISTLFLLFLQHIYIKIVSPKVNLEKSDKGIIVKYTIVDEHSSKGYDTIDDIMDKNEDSIIYNSYGFETIKKKDSNTYEGKLSNANEMLTNGVVDYAFAKMNTNGEVIKDATYDKKTRKITIPAKYIEKESIQMQVLVKLTNDKIINTNIKTKILNGSIKKNTIKQNGFDTQTYITLDDYDSNKKIEKDSISVYVNNKYKVKDENYSYDQKSKTIKLTLNPMLANDIEVVIEKKSIIENLFKSVFAAFVDIKGDPTTSDDADGIKLTSEPTLKQGDSGKSTLKWAYYNGRIPYNGTYEDNATVAYLNQTVANGALVSTTTCEEGKNADNPYPKCPERNLVSNVIDEAKYVMGFPGSEISLSTYEKTPTLNGNFIITHDYDTTKSDTTSRDVEFAIRLDKNLFGTNFVHDEDNSSVLYGDNYFWVAAYCLHITDRASTTVNVEKKETLEFSYKVLYKGDSTNPVMIVQFIMPTNETAGGQNAYGVYKFYWENEPEAKIQVEKKFADGNTTASISDKSGIQFKIYTSKDNCNKGKKSKGTATTDKNGLAQFTNSSGTESFKMNTTYYVKETDLGSKFSDKDWTMDTKCTKVKVTKKDGGHSSVEKEDDVIKFYVKKITKTNIKKRYCFKIRKKDNESNCVVSGIKFQLKSGSTNVGSEQTTNSSGKVGFSNLSYKDYKYVETSSNGTTATEHCDGQSTTHKYWNSSPISGDVKKEELTEMIMTVEDNGNITYTCPADDNKVKIYTKKDNRYHYCVVVKKVDANTGAALEGAVFNATNAIGFQYIQYNSAGAASSTLGDGLAYFYLGESTSSTITESQAPTSYALSTEKINATAVALPEGSATAGIEFVTACQQAYKDAGIEEAKYTMKDQKLLINWYKENENGKAVSGARFNARYTDENNSYKYIKVKMSDSGNRVKVDYPENSPQKKCYVFDSFATETQKNNLQSTEQNPVDLVSDDNGEVCIIGVPNNGKKVGDNTQAQGAYTIVETKPAKYHTFSNKKTIQLNLTTSIQAKTSNNTFTNYETEFEFTKDVSSGDSNTEIIINGVKKTLKELTTEELQKIEFNIYNSNGDILHFVKNSDGTYDFAGNDKDAPSNLTGASSALYLNKNRKLKVLHLPEGTYSIKESQGSTCTNSTDSSKCVGYYYPNYSSNSSHQFTITDCSSSKATSCTTYGVVTQKLTNTPTEITFTKKDFYSYYDAADKNKSEENVKFENDKERNDFDKIVFKIKDSSGRYLTLKKVADHGDCSTDDSYSEYRYVSSDQTDKNGTELHTCGGHIKITNLCRGNEYTVEEVSVPDGSVYVKENTTSTPTSAKYQIPCTEGDTTHKTTTNIINDKPTRVRFEKRDSKYNYLIDDETTTFEVYKCKKGTECHPADYKTVAEREKNGMTLVKFSPRAVITKDEEDPTDAAGLAGVEVYKKISDSDVSKGQKYVTSLHPYKGLLVLRYLESNDPNSSYVLLETVAPYNYSVPSGRNAETRFTVTNTTVKVDEIDVPNKPTSLIIRKYSDDGKLLPGAEFKVYEGTSCNSNLSAMNQPKKLLKLKTIRDGVYENRPEQDTDTVLTCTDKDGAKCSDIAVNNMTSLTYKNYQNTWADFNESLTNDNKKVQIKEGEALIQYLEYDHCYIIEETKAPKGYSLPKNDEDRFTMVTIPKNTEYVSDTYKTLINKPTPFTFYKYDEYNNLLDGAEFKLQKLDSNKKYHDIRVTKEETETGVFYKVDKSTDNKVITTKDGKATVYYLEEGQYRIVETKAAPGKELGKNPNVATFFVDSAGNVYGNSIIVNKAKTETLSFTSSASAEFLIWNRTGQTVIRYGLIISSIVAVIVALMIALRIKKKSE